MAVKYLAGERLIGTAAERTALTTGMPNFEDNFNSTTGWTNSSKITVNSGVSNKLYYNGVPDNETGNHATRALGITLDDENWIAEIEIDAIVGESGGDGTNPLFCLFAAGTTTTVKSANQDFIGIAIHTVSNNPTVFELSACYKDGSNSFSGQAGGSRIGVPINTKRYIRLERTSATGVRLSIYSDSFGGTHVTDSPRTYTIPSTIGSLNSLIFVDAQTGGAGGETYLTADNLKVWNDATSTTAVYPNLINGAIFEESETGTHYMWDGTSVWNEVT